LLANSRWNPILGDLNPMKLTPHTGLVNPACWSNSTTQSNAEKVAAQSAGVFPHPAQKVIAPMHPLFIPLTPILVFPPLAAYTPAIP